MCLLFAAYFLLFIYVLILSQFDLKNVVACTYNKQQIQPIKAKYQKKL